MFKKQTYRLPKKAHYWKDVIIGGVLMLWILIPSGILFFREYELNYLIYPYTLLCVLIILYYQWSADNFKEIQTGLSQSKNFELISNTLNQLDWHHTRKSTDVALSLNKYILKFLEPTIVPKSSRILINFKYYSTEKTGRLPFFFGISTYVEWRFRLKLKKTLRRQL